VSYFLALVLTFTTVFLKGLQHKNVIHNLYLNTFFTSYAMAFMDVLVIGLIARSGWMIAFASGTGGAVGMVAAMYLHNRYMKTKGAKA
jgi:ABC-type phosphate transport system permease subunit